MFKDVAFVSEAQLKAIKLDRFILDLFQGIVAAGTAGSLQASRKQLENT